MADPLTRLGISRRPAYELFGTPDTSKFGWSDATRQAVAEDQAMADEAVAAEEERAALEDRRIAREREREAEGLADQITRMRNPSAREKFFDQNEAALTGSRRYNQLAEIRQRAPSYADNVLANNLASKMEDPDERNVFLDAVSQGLGTLAAREEADRFRIMRNTDAELAKLGKSPQERKRIMAEEGVGEAVINFYASEAKKSSTGGGDDTRMKDLKGLVDLLREQKEAEEFESGKATDETLADYTRAKTELKKAYESRAFPPASPILTQTPPAAGPRPPLAAAGAQQPPVSGFKNVMGAGKTPVAEPQEIQQQIEQEIESPAADETFFSGIISNPNVPAETKVKTLEKFRQYAKSPTPKGESIRENLVRREVINKALKQAEKEVELIPVRDEWNKTWSAEKGRVNAAIQDFASYLGVSPENVIASLIKDEKLSVPAEGKVGDEVVPVRTLLARRWKGDQNIGAYDFLNREGPESINVFANSPYAGDIGMGGILGTGLGSKVTYGDVLDKYLEDLKPSVPQAASAGATVVEVSTREEVESLSPGTKFKGPDGKIRIR